MVVLQPCDWHEHDVSLYINKKREQSYVVDVYGRTDTGQVACVRITGFSPYFYCGGPDPGKAYPVKKYDVFAGFNNLSKSSVWKVSCSSLNEFHERKREMGARDVPLYESDLPPFLRLIHERHLGPGSPLKFEATPIEVPDDTAVDEMYTCPYTSIFPSDAAIPLKVASYDLEVCPLVGQQFPMAIKDPIIQIGVSFRMSNDLMTPTSRYVFVLGSVDKSDDPNTTFFGCRSEADVLYAFLNCILDENPDIICGYNTFGFDDGYVEERCKQLGLTESINLSRAPAAKTKKGDNWAIKFAETKKFELASGKYDLRIMCLRGRLSLDLLLNMRREHSLDSFKLDNVASTFLRDKVLSYQNNVVTTKSTRGLCVGNYARFDLVGNTTDPYREGEKFRVIAIKGNTFTVDAPTDLFAELTEKERKSLEWTFTKDDVEPHELFRLHREGGSAGRTRIARYCIQDCDLVLTLMAKLDTLVNTRGMADVCKVPMQFVLTRGQGIKIFSAVVYYASQRDQIIRTLENVQGDQTYEGAIVISPKIGMYLDQPISVLDFNSLYPSNMIAYNLSPDSLVCERHFDSEGRKIAHYGPPMEKVREYEENYTLDEMEYDLKDDKDAVYGKVICTFVQPKKDNPMTVGVIPKTLEILLAKRKEYKQMMEDPKYDDAQRSVYNGLQLAYKVVANSVYGQAGSRTSPIRKLCVAACTTAAGRKALYFAKSVVESPEFGGEVVYGDTDSIFVKFPTKDVAESIRLGLAAGKSITTQMARNPYKIAYEKTFYPFILFCRKRYVGMKYEEDPNPAKAKRMSMGIVLKRRDNAPIVKDVFGGALDILLQERNVKKGAAFVKEKLKEVIDHKVPLEKFIVSKSLRDDYKNPDQIAHRVLADRMTERDPGTAPKVGDRVQYVYVENAKKGAKQGDRIEHVDYVKAKKLKVDTTFYITNQIQNPVAQLFALCIDQLDGYTPPRSPSYADLYAKFMDKLNNEEEATLAVLDKKEKQLESLLFLESPDIKKVVRANQHGPLDAFFLKK
jgi:DNA polymerase elongation subunit (family B)